MQIQKETKNSKRFLTRSFIFIGVVFFLSVVVYQSQHSNSTLLKMINLEPKGDIPTLHLIIEKKHYKKLNEKKDKALAAKVMIQSEDDYVPGKIKLDSKMYDIDLRLKGDLTDHLIGDQWSFRIKLKDGIRFKGMKKFSIQRPSTRKYMAEWVIQKARKYEDLIYLRYHFFNLVINGQELGLYSLEEHFDGLLIENNKLREGVLLGLTDDISWLHRARYGHSEEFLKTLHYYSYYNIRLFNPNKVLNDPELKKQFIKAQDLLEGLRRKKLKASDIFDVEKLGTHFAMIDLYGGQHSVLPGNLRFYYNPVSHLLEPIGFDHDGLFPLYQFIGEVFHDLNNNIGNYGAPYFDIWNDRKFSAAYFRALDRISDPKYIMDFLHSIQEETVISVQALINDNKEFKHSLDTIYKNARYIRKKLELDGVVLPYLTNDKKIKVANISDLPLVIKGIYHNNNIVKELDTYLVPNPKFRSIEFLDLGQIDHSVFELQLAVQISGLKKTHFIDFLPWPLHKTEKFTSIADSISNYKTKLKDYFIIDGDQLIFKNKITKIPETIFIPAHKKVIAQKGQQIHLENNASIFSRSPFIFQGSDEYPIFIFGKGKQNGIIITDTKRSSEFYYTHFDKLSAPIVNDIAYSSAITFHQAPVRLDHVRVSNINAEDSLNFIRTRVTMTNSYMENTLSDSLDCDFCEGQILKSFFKNAGNDALDFAGAKVEIQNVTVDGAKNKAISVGEQSQIKIKDSILKNTPYGVVTKDRSESIIQTVHLENVSTGFVSMQKKAHYGPSYVQLRNITAVGIDKEYIVEYGSRIAVKSKMMEQILDEEDLRKLNELKQD